MLVSTAGHLHPGGLYDTLDLVRPGATPSGGATPGSGPNSVRLFRSRAHYWDRRGPISWDMSMTATPARWRPQVKAGDVLRISATYDSNRASWYEVMGIMVVWEAWDEQDGVDPFTRRLTSRARSLTGACPRTSISGATTRSGSSSSRSTTASPRVIAQFLYSPGDFPATGADHCAPTIRQAQRLTFVNYDASPLTPGNPLNPARLLARSFTPSPPARARAG